MWSEKLRGCPVVLSSLGKCIAQVQNSSYRTSAAPIASNNAKGEREITSAPVTEEYKPESDWEEGGKENTDLSSLVSWVLSTYNSCRQLYLLWSAFPKEGSARATLTACSFHHSCQYISQNTMMWRSIQTKGNRYNKTQKRMPSESGRKKGKNCSKQNQVKQRKGTKWQKERTEKHYFLASTVAHSHQEGCSET